MKLKLALILWFLSSYTWAQTEQLEKDNIHNKFKNGEFSVEAFKQYANDWKEMIQSVGEYPELPYEKESGMIKFSFVQETGQPKKINYDRIMEWAAINFGSIKSVLQYENLDNGKIILKGNFDVTHKNVYQVFFGRAREGLKTTKCKQTYIFTIKDNFIKVEIVDVKYEFKLLGYTGGSVYVPDRIYEVSIHNVYPITNYDSDKWKEMLDLLFQTNLKIELLVSDLTEYVKDYENDLEF